MTKEDEIKFLRIALSMQNIGISNQMADQLIQTYNMMKKKGGKMNISDAVDIELEIERKYKELELKTKKSEAKP